MDAIKGTESMEGPGNESAVDFLLDETQESHSPVTDQETHETAGSESLTVKDETESETAPEKGSEFEENETHFEDSAEGKEDSSEKGNSEPERKPGEEDYRKQQEEIENLQKRLHDTQSALHEKSGRLSALQKEMENLKAKAENEDDWFSEEDKKQTESVNREIQQTNAEIQDLNNKAAEAIWDAAAAKVRESHPDFDQVVYGEFCPMLDERTGNPQVISMWKSQSDKSPANAYRFAQHVKELLEMERDPEAYRAKIKEEVKKEYNINQEDSEITGKDGLDMLNSADSVPLNYEVKGSAVDYIFQ